MKMNRKEMRAMYSCYYGQAILMQSTIEEFDRDEGPRVINHVNDSVYPLINIWLKTYGLKSFVVQCRQWEVDKCIKDLNLIRKEDTP